MATAGSNVRMRVWKKVVVALTAGVVVLGALIYWKRYEIVLWNMEGNEKAQEASVLMMLENARPIIARELKMTLPEKIIATLTGKRNQKERQTDALKDIRQFAELNFENHRLKFIDVHNLRSLNGFNLQGLDFALGWNGGNKEEVLSAFNFNFLKRDIGNKFQINQDCSFFKELRLYIEKKAKAN